MAMMSEKYRLYHLYLFVEVMTEEMNELMRFGVSPLGVGYINSLNKDQQDKLRPLLMKIADCVKDTTEKIIEEGVAAPDTPVTSEEWVRIMLEELRTRVSAIGDTSAQELKGVTGLLHEMEDILEGKNRPNEEQ